MSLIETSLPEVVKRQFIFKVKSYFGMFVSLASVQAIAILFSFNGVGQMGLDGGLSISSYSGSMVFIFTAFWAFITAITLTTKSYHYIDYSFVTNRMSSHLSTVGMLIVYSFIASATSTFAGILLRVILFFKEGGNKIIAEHFFLPFSDLLIGIYVGALYLVLFAMFGYLIGMFVQIHKLFGFLIPAVLFGWIIMEGRAYNTFNTLAFIFKETSILLFSAKIIITSALFVGIVILATNRLEVRK